MFRYKKTILVISTISMMIFIFIAYPYRHKIKRKLKAIIVYYYNGNRRGSRNCPTCSEIFIDNVKTHELAYVNEGLKPQDEDKDLDRLFKKGKLKVLETNDLYIVKKANFSLPYILPIGHSFIEDLSKNYREKCKANSIEYVPFTISSVTRSKKSVEKLKNNNSNAITNSAHLKGKTFDISYKAFNNNKKQTKAFIEALKELRNQNKCYVKFERNGCLHITVI